MYRILKSVFAELSYCLEKYLCLDSILWSILLVAAGCAMVSVVLIKTAEILTKKKFNILYYLCTVICSYFIDVLLLRVQTWDSKLQRVMSNWNYVMSFQSNQEPFFQALGIPCNAANRSGSFRLAMFLNGSQWEKVANEFGEGGWYFQKVEKAMQEILQIRGRHLCLGIINQDVAAWIPLLAILFLGAALLIRKQWVSGAAVICCGALCLLGNLGASIFMLAMLLAIWFFKWWLGKLIERRPKKAALFFSGK